jgi:hypothetical protein
LRRLKIITGSYEQKEIRTIVNTMKAPSKGFATCHERLDRIPAHVRA